MKTAFTGIFGLIGTLIKWVIALAVSIMVAMASCLFTMPLIAKITTIDVIGIIVGFIIGIVVAVYTFKLCLKGSKASKS